MIREKDTTSEIVIDLTGPEGNAFVLLGYAKRYANDLDYSEEEVEDLEDVEDVDLEDEDDD